MITSIAACEPVPNLMLSNSLRAGLHGLVNALSKEVAGDQVTVNALMPGYTLTERLEELHLDEVQLAAQIPARRLGRSQDFAAVAAFGLHAARFDHRTRPALTGRTAPPG